MLQAKRNGQGVAMFDSWPDSPALRPEYTNLSWQEAFRLTICTEKTVPATEAVLRAALAEYDSEIS